MKGKRKGVNGDEFCGESVEKCDSSFVSTLLIG